MQTQQEATRRHCFFEGRVQGVGFRYTTRNISISYDVTGFVRNLSDGRVELVAEGPDEQVSAFIDDVRDRMRSYIRDAVVEDEPASGQYVHFIISR